MLFCGFVCPFNVFAQTDPLRVKYNFVIDDGDRSGTKVDIERDGASWKQRDGTDAKNYIDLEFQHEYVMTFSKPGFITKKIAISTVVPKKNLDEPFDPLTFNVTIFRQYEGVNVVVFNNPVARYAYLAKKGFFEYDTDYSKTIISQVKKAEDELKVKHKADKSATGTQPVGNKSVASTIDKKSVTKVQKPEEPKAAAPKPVEVVKKKEVELTKSTSENRTGKSAAGEKKELKTIPKKKTENSGRVIAKPERINVADKKPTVVNKRPANIITDMDSRSSLFAGAGVMDDNHIEREYVDGNKRITETIVTRGGRKYIYKKIAYVWGVYYFRDNVSITEPTYVQEVL